MQAIWIGLFGSSTLKKKFTASAQEINSFGPSAKVPQHQPKILGRMSWASRRPT
jgi:hypothetical protein